MTMRVVITKAGPIFAIIILLFITSCAFAQEPVLNFATLQDEKSISMLQGGNYTTRLYFFNPYGNRVAHVRVYPAGVPEGWGVKIEPAIQNGTHDIGGTTVNYEENMDVEPEPPVTQPGQNTIEISGISGYVPAKIANIIFTAPGNASGSYTIWIDATAGDISQSGMVGLVQGRRFEYVINVGGTAEKKPEKVLISSTISGIPINFQYVLPGHASQAMEGQGFPAKVRIDALTNVATSIYLAGTDFRSEKISFGVSNMTYSNTSDGEKTEMSGDYSRIVYSNLENIPPPSSDKPEVRELYFWLSVPPGQSQGNYANVISIAVTQTGLVPAIKLTEPVIVSVAVPPTTTIPVATTSKTPTPGFEILIAFAALTIVAFFVRRR